MSGHIIGSTAGSTHEFRPRKAFLSSPARHGAHRRQRARLHSIKPQAAMRRRLILMALCGALLHGAAAFAQQVGFVLNPRTGAVDSLSVDGDGTMKWLMRTDGSQYAWVAEEYGWGLGRFTEIRDGVPAFRTWKEPAGPPADSLTRYRSGEVEIAVRRRLEDGGMTESYTFTNMGRTDVTLAETNIYTPFNDNYPDAATCMASRVNAHIWPGGHAAYAQAVPMSGRGPSLGLMVTDGAVTHYEISARGQNRGSSNTRGVISLTLPDMHLKPGESAGVSWRLFAYDGAQDFFRKMEEHGGVWVEAEKYVLEKGDTARLTLHASHTPAKLSALKNGVPVPVRPSAGGWTVESPMEELGEARFEFVYDGGKRTQAACLTVSSERNLLARRVDFIIARQQMTDPADPRYGAYMVYDNEADTLFLNDRRTVSPADRDEGGERLGMGVLLAKQYLLTRDERIRESLMKYVRFVRTKLQDGELRVWSTTDHQGRHRAYNYPWVAILYLHMYQITGERAYLTDAYGTLRTMFRHFGHGFYAIDIPVRLSLQCLKEAGMKKEHDQLLDDYLRIGDIYVKNGCHYPKHEVNYEQSIVAPSVMFLTQLYLATGTQKYLDEARRQLPLLEALASCQPDYHMNRIAIRHWDGYWFGKREMWGDVYPHYWSTLTAAAYHYYYLCSGDASYQHRAEQIVRGNLCLFFEDGKASCAYVYPHRVNGVRAGFYDPFANDQDWALGYYILVNDDL